MLSVGGEVDVGISAQPDEIPGSSSSWTAMSNDAGTEIKSVKSGYQYTVQLIDTESQRVIYETTITA